MTGVLFVPRLPPLASSPHRRSSHRQQVADRHFTPAPAAQQKPPVRQPRYLPDFRREIGRKLTPAWSPLDRQARSDLDAARNDQTDAVEGEIGDVRHR